MTKTLLPPNTTSLERDIEQVTDRPIDVELDTLWDADRIAEHLLPWLAWAVGVRQWSDEWSEARKRAEVKNALNIRRRAGTLGALRQVIGMHGIEGGDIDEWFDYQGQPGHFRLVLDLDGVGISKNGYEELIIGLTRAKRLSAHFDPTQISTTTRGHVQLGAGKHTSGNITLQPYRPSHLTTSGAATIGAGQHASTTITLTPYHPRQLAAPGPITIGTGQHASGQTTIYPS